jgi:hypothetical protein
MGAQMAKAEVGFSLTYLRRKFHTWVKNLIPVHEKALSTFNEMKFPIANPKIANYNASIVNFYNATGSLAHFENKNILVYF